MPTLTVAGHDVTVGDDFLKLSPEDQQSMVNHIATQLPAKSDAPSGVVDGFKHGIASTVGGDASTIGLTGAPTDGAGSGFEPKNYKAAPLIREGGHWYNPMDYQPSSIPQLAAEAAPGMAQDMSAGWAAGKMMPGSPQAKALAGMGGYAGSMLLRTFGPGAHAKADAETGVPNSPVTGGNIMREAASQAATLPLNMLGGKLLLPGAGKVTGSVLAKLGKTVGTEGLIGGGTDAIDQAATTAGSKEGFNIDGNQVATSAASRAIGSTLMAAPGAARDARANQKYGGYESTPETKAAAEAVATRMKDIAGDRAVVGPLGGTSVAADAMSGAHKEIHTELKAASANEALSPDASHILERINAGDNVTPEQVTKLSKEASPETMHLAHQAIIAKQEIARGNLTDGKFTGGLGGAMENLPLIRTPVKSILGTAGTVVAGHAGLGTLAGTLGAVAPAALAATAGVYGGARMIDRLTGARSPAAPFMDRFGGTDTPTRFDTPPPAPQDPATTSVPQIAPPQNTQLWGAPKPAEPTPSAQNADIKGMLLMAAARRKAAEAQAPVAPPTAPGIDANAQNADIQGMLRMAAARRDVAGRQQAEALAADSPAINDQGGLSALSNPAFAKHGSALLKAASVMKNLTAQPEEAAAPMLPPEPAAPAAPAPAAPAAPVVPAAPAPQAAPNIDQLLKNMRATSAAKAAQNPAATPPGGVVAPPATAAPAVTPPVEAAPAPPAVLPTPKVSALTKLKGKVKETTGPSEYMDPDTGEMLSHTPLTKDQLWGRNMSHDQFAARETADKLGSGELEPEKAQAYHDAVVGDRVKREHEMQVASQHEAGPDDVPLAKLLLQELHHQRYGDDARSAAKFYGSHMSPPMRAAVAKLMDGPFNKMWSKDSANRYAPKAKYKSGSSSNEHMPTASILHKLKLMEAAQ